MSTSSIIMSNEIIKANTNVLLFPTVKKAINRGDEPVGCKERLGGLLKYYHREAA